MAPMVLFGILALCAFASGNRVELRYEPKPKGDHFNTLLWYNKTSYDFWANRLDDYLKPYNLPSTNKIGCSYKNPPENGKACRFKTETWGPCISSNRYGFKSGSPCIFIELQKTFDWRPKYYNSTKHLPKHMPEGLKEQLKSIESSESKEEWETLWVTCEGENPGDKESIGPVGYVPVHGFPGYLFPYTGQKGYLNPLIAVHFQNPYHGMVISIVCRAWAANIKHDPILRTGETKFQLLIDV